MRIYINGALTPPADAGSLDGIPAALQPVGSGVDGYVVTYDHATGDLELQAGGGGMANPMNAVGNLIVGGPVVGGIATPTRLAAGSAGYILRVAGGTPVWRELFDPGLLAARPDAAATREGQWYWATNAAAGLELSVCTHQGGGTYAWVTVPYGVTATGVALVQAANAAAARAAISAAEAVSQPAYDFTSSTGLTTFLGSAGNTITVGGGVAALYTPAAAPQVRFGNPRTGPALSRNFPEPVAEFDVAARVLPFSGSSPLYFICRPGIEVATLGSFANPALPRQRLTFMPFHASPGTVSWENELGMQEENLGGVVLMDGTGWLRIQLIGTTMTFWTGVGVGTAMPTTWTMRKRWVPTAALYESVCVSLQVGGSQTPVTANFGALAVLLPASL